MWIHFCGDSQNQPGMTFFLTLRHPRTSHVTLNCSHVRKHLMVFFPNFECTDSVLPKPVGSLLTATPVSTIKVANKDETGRRLYVQGEWIQCWPPLHSKREGADRKQAALKHGLYCVAKWLAECLMLISFSIKTHSGATLVGVANWATTNLHVSNAFLHT